MKLGKKISIQCVEMPNKEICGLGGTRGMPGSLPKALQMKRRYLPAAASLFSDGLLDVENSRATDALK